MKLSIGLRMVDGPWGGGNAFARYLAAYMQEKGHVVVSDLEHPDIDCILLMDPRKKSASATFQDAQIMEYRKNVNPAVKVIHRVNECDERKGTQGVNQRIIEANQVADHTVFVASWLKELHEKQGIPCARRSVILNGADINIFHAKGNPLWDGEEPFKLVTHHWGGNWMKGFDVYEALDQQMADPEFSRKWQFTYIGNVPEGFEFKHARYQEPLSGESLAAELRSHHGYISASINEPGSHHQNEGGNCGLPILYRKSGCLPEYCEGFGVEYHGPEDLMEQMDQFRQNYGELKSLMPGFPRTAERMASEYLELINEVVKLDVGGQQNERVVMGNVDQQKRNEKTLKEASRWWKTKPFFEHEIQCFFKKDKAWVKEAFRDFVACKPAWENLSGLRSPSSKTDGMAKTIDLAEGFAMWCLICSEKPRRVVELGTQYGISGRLWKEALKKYVPEHELILCDLEDQRTLIGDDECTFLEGDGVECLHEAFKRGDVDLLFNDAHPYLLIRDSVNVAIAHKVPAYAFHDTGCQHPRGPYHPEFYTMTEEQKIEHGMNYKDYGHWERHLIGAIFDERALNQDFCQSDEASIQTFDSLFGFSAVLTNR
ncbi:MAG: hypothetical protein AAF571_10275 [Verrucomicrobiota bacterium]